MDTDQHEETAPWSLKGFLALQQSRHGYEYDKPIADFIQHYSLSVIRCFNAQENPTVGLMALVPFKLGKFPLGNELHTLLFSDPDTTRSLARFETQLSDILDSIAKFHKDSKNDEYIIQSAIALQVLIHAALTRAASLKKQENIKFRERLFSQLSNLRITVQEESSYSIRTGVMAGLIYPAQKLLKPDLNPPTIDAPSTGRIYKASYSDNFIASQTIESKITLTKLTESELNMLKAGPPEAGSAEETLAQGKFWSTHIVNYLGCDYRLDFWQPDLKSIQTQTRSPQGPGLILFGVVFLLCAIILITSALTSFPVSFFLILLGGLSGVTGLICTAIGTHLVIASGKTNTTSTSPQQQGSAPTPFINRNLKIWLEAYGYSLPLPKETLISLLKNYSQLRDSIDARRDFAVFKPLLEKNNWDTVRELGAALYFNKGFLELLCEDKTIFKTQVINFERLEEVNKWIEQLQNPDDKKILKESIWDIVNEKTYFEQLTETPDAYKKLESFFSEVENIVTIIAEKKAAAERVAFEKPLIEKEGENTSPSTSTATPQRLNSSF